MSYKQLAVSVDYVAALKNIISDLPANNIVASDANTKVNAGGINADYSFKTFELNSKVGVSYQWSDHAVDISDLTVFPKNRYQADYKINIVKNVDADFIVARNKGYDVAGQSPTANVGLAKLMVQF